MALEGNRISSRPRLEIAKRNFDAKREWAKRRYNSLPKQTPLPLAG